MAFLTLFGLQGKILTDAIAEIAAKPVTCNLCGGEAFGDLAGVRTSGVLPAAQSSIPGPRCWSCKN